MTEKESKKKQNPPSRRGVKWSNDEEGKVLKALSEDVEIEAIAKNHNRTTWSIRNRISEIAYRMLCKGSSHMEVCKVTKMSLLEIKELIEKRKKSQRKLTVKEASDVRKDIKIIKEGMEQMLKMITVLYKNRNMNDKGFNF